MKTEKDSLFLVMKRSRSHVLACQIGLLSVVMVTTIRFGKVSTCLVDKSPHDGEKILKTLAWTCGVYGESYV